jgi:diaminopimelate decarboxylase
VNLRPMIAAFGSIDSQLAVGGMPLDRLTARVGSTPYFAYDRRLLTERVQLLRPRCNSAMR